MIKLLESIGRYVLLLGKVFSRPEKMRIYLRRVAFEIEALGFNSISLTAIISTFIGAVMALQMAITLESPFIPQFMIGYATREVMVLEFSSTVLALILSGKIGSNIASEIGTMRITEQIDAMEMMGVNSAGFLVLPKIVATTLLSPLLMFLSLVLGLIGGYLVVETTQIIPTASYITGIKAFYNGFYVFYSCFKMSLFCFMISSISAFNGYYAKGGSLGVGRSSTKAIVVTSILILLADLIVTQLMLY